ncbi:MAG TPA: DUF2891 family protein [Edaphobacter sp.]|jgi:hypothetical protein|nr:DUF2891 family protein [Edaphobacter sp.]
MRTLIAPLALSLALAAPSLAQPDTAHTAAYLKTLPNTPPPVIDQAEVVTLAALPLSCIDHPQDAPDHPHDYLWVHDSKRRTVDDYDKTRAFYGCFDWHSAVNSTWTLIYLLKQNPRMALAPIIRQRLNEHLAKTNIAGEVAFFADAKDTEGKNFERPYGYTWLFKIYGELASWNDPDAQKLAANTEPLYKQLSEKYIEYLKRLPYPVRVGTHPSSALTMNFALDSTDLAPNPALKSAIDEAALRFFSKDKNCATAYEPGNGDFLSPCLTEAMLMARVMDQKTFVTWLDTFLPAVYSPEFQVYAADIDTTRTAAAGSNADAEDKDGLLGSKAHLIGLAFERAAALLRIASSLPPADPRVPVYRRLATINAENGFRKIGDAGYLGQHWLATYAVLYMQQATLAK